MGEEKTWKTLSYQELDQLMDIKKKQEYYQQIRKTLEWLNPLYMYALRHGFNDEEFKEQVTVQDSVMILKQFYDDCQISNEDRIAIALHRKK